MNIHSVFQNFFCKKTVTFARDLQETCPVNSSLKVISPAPRLVFAQQDTEMWFKTTRTALYLMPSSPFSEGQNWPQLSKMVVLTSKSSAIHIVAAHSSTICPSFSPIGNLAAFYSLQTNQLLALYMSGCT